MSTEKLTEVNGYSASLETAAAALTLTSTKADVEAVFKQMIDESEHNPFAVDTNIYEDVS